MLVAARDAGVAMPSAVFALSPAADLSLASPSIRDVTIPDLFMPAGAAQQRDSFAAYLSGADPRDGRASPVYADLSGLPPLLVEVGGAERLIDDARRLVERAVACGVPASLAVTEGGFHTLPILAPDTPEAEATMARIAAHLAVPARPGALPDGPPENEGDPV
jgi:acetyl esterase/lipase